MDTRICAVRASRLFDGFRLHTGFPLVLIDGARIAGIDTSGARPSADLPVVDLGDVTVLPGLIDSHVHLAFDPENKAKQTLADSDDATLLSQMRRHALQHLHAGVTTVRDLGDLRYLAVRLRDQEGLGPEIVAAGPPLTRIGGHCWFLGGEADGESGLRQAVAEHVTRGADVIKIMATGGVITPGWGPHESQYSRDELAAAVRAAHELGKPITAHAHGPQGITDAVAAGVDGIEHGSFFTEDGVEADWETVAAMAKAGTFVGATEAWLPEGVMVAPHMASRLAERSENFVRMHREGVPLICCSDAGVGPRKPHGVLPYGVVQFGSMGLSNTEAIAAVTSLAAQACGLAHRKGRIAVGYDADLVAVADNPLHRLEAIHEVRAVIRAGVQVPLTQT